MLSFINVQIFYDFIAILFELRHYNSNSYLFNFLLQFYNIMYESLTCSDRRLKDLETV